MTTNVLMWTEVGDAARGREARIGKIEAHQTPQESVAAGDHPLGSVANLVVDWLAGEYANEVQLPYGAREGCEWALGITVTLRARLAAIHPFNLCRAILTGFKAQMESDGRMTPTSVGLHSLMGRFGGRGAVEPARGRELAR